MTNLTAQIGQLTPEKIRLLAKAIHAKRAQPPGPALERHTGLSEYPLSFGQERLWFLDRLAPGNAAYNWPFAVSLEVDLDPELFRRTMAAIATRHEIMRTAYIASGDSAIQRVTAECPVPQTVIDLRDLGSAAGEQEALRLIREDARIGFDLARAPLYRYFLFEIGPAHWIFGGTMHHSLIDAWSRKVMMEEMGAIWTALAMNQPALLPDLKVQYGDYAIWQRALLQGQIGGELLNYWTKQLEDVPQLDLPASYARPAMMSFQGKTEIITIPLSVTESLRSLARQESATLFMTLFAAFQVLMMRYTGQTDVAGAVPVGSRDRVELEALIGFFINTLVLRVDLSGNPTFRELLQRVRRVAVDAYSHQQMPFERLVDELQPKRDLSRSPLAQFIFQLEDIPKARGNVSGAAKQRGAKPLDLDAGTAVFDFHIHLYEAWDAEMMERPEGIRGTFVYRSDVFKPEMIGRLLAHFDALLKGLASDPEKRIWDYGLLSDHETEELTNWNETFKDLGGDATVAGRFEAVVRRMPHADALVCPGQRWSYAELNCRANRLAHTLRELGAGPEMLVAICMDRTPDSIAAVVAVLKSGAAYLPLDPEYPPHRLESMLAGARVAITLTQHSLLNKLATKSAGITLAVDTYWETASEQSVENPPAAALPGNLAYAIYTSGSTGHPKAAGIEHRQIVSYADAASDRLGLLPRQKMALISTLAADLGHTILYPALCNGCELHILSRDLASSPSTLAAYLTEQQIDTIKIAPSHLAGLMLDDVGPDLMPLRSLILGGEAVPREWVKTLRTLRPNTRIFNHYGPTETTVGALTYAVTEELPWTQSGTVPLGRPLANTQVYLLDRQLSLVPLGVRGEVYIGGAGLGRGYLGRPGTTADRFVPSPFGKEPGSRLYRTGDLGRRLDDGNIEFLGRADEQVKIHGYRVELGEIEAAVAGHPSVKDCAVVLREQTAGREVLACIVPESATAEGELDSPGEERVTEWRHLYEELYDHPPSDEEEIDNFVGWNSSYTGLPIPKEDMQESVSRTVERILESKPQRVLEIGCGTGLLLFQAAPHCQYCATDFSSSAVAFVQKQASRIGLSVPVFHRSAEDVSDFDAGSFDVVVLNSVIQYFPSLDYLLRVLHQAQKMLRPGGSIFLGDVRSLPLLEAFHTSVELSRSAITAAAGGVRRSVSKRIAREEECVIDPAFFEGIGRWMQGIGRVDVQLKRGHYNNELTKFRYDVVLETTGLQMNSCASPETASSVTWKDGGRSWGELLALLEREKPRSVCIQGVPNARLRSDCKALRLLQETEATSSIGDVRVVLDQHDESGRSPEEFWSLGERVGYRTRVRWAADGQVDRFDVFLDQLPAEGVISGMGVAAEKVEPGRPLLQYTNNPLRGIRVRALVRDLRLYLAERLPSYMLPSAYSIMDRLPLLPSGKLNRRLLKESEAEEATPAGNFIAPRDSFELRLAQIWEELLDLQRVGIKDSFFELGGHSLLAIRVISRVQAVFGQTLPLSLIFEQPTIEELAAGLRGGLAEEQVSPLVVLRQAGEGTPLCLVHPAGGGVLCYYELTRHLGGGRPIYGLQFQGFNMDAEPYVSVEGMAQEYVRALQHQQPHGPYLLGGWSAGGVIAFEMARQLLAQGGEPSVVLVLDMRAPVAATQRPSPDLSQAEALVSLSRKLELYTGKEFHLAPHELDGLDEETQLEFFVQRMKSRNLVPGDVTAAWLRDFLAIYEDNVRAIRNYRPESYPGVVHLIRGMDSLAEVEQEFPEIYRDPALGWQSLCTRQVITHETPGNHLSMISPPNVEALAQMIKEQIAAY